MLHFLTTDTSQRLWRAIEAKRTLSKEEFRDLVREAKARQQAVAALLLSRDERTSRALLPLLAQHFGVPAVLLRDRVISPYVMNLIPKAVAAAHGIIVFKKIKDVVHVATIDPEDQQAMTFVQRKTGCTPKVFLTTNGEIQEALRRYQTDITTEFSELVDEGTKQTLASHDSAEKMAEYLPIIRMVETIIARAARHGASDIHLEPTADKVTIRYRIDGLLKRIVELPKAVHLALVARVKILSNVKIDEHRAPQDGRFQFTDGNRDMAIRVSIVPTLHGAKVVLRLLDNQDRRFTLSNLGFNSRDLVTIRREIAKPHGMILVTGPTGSGKTTTLYTLLRMLHREQVNITTIEDPIEYGLDGVNQTQINPGAGLTFATGLRSLLRQDPNVIMVGEIRDLDTADIAMNAAMTGHLVLSTLHTNNAFLAVQRLVEMGVQPFLTASVLNVAIGQRLVRRVCQHCRVTTRLNAKVLERYRGSFDVPAILTKLKRVELMPAGTSVDDLRIASGRGCDRCADTGYQGRLVIAEVIPMTEHLHSAVLHDPTALELKRVAVAEGALTMAEDGVLKALHGQTTFDEVLRATKE